MKQKELQKLTEEISLKYFKRPFQHQVVIDKRLRTTGGRYNLRDHHIDINAHYLAPEYYDYLIGIIKHELTHYHLHLLGMGYQHRDRDFKLLLKRVGGSRYAPDIGLYKSKKYKYLYKCEDCQLSYYRVRKVNTKLYRCGKCHGKLKLIKSFA